MHYCGTAGGDRSAWRHEQQRLTRTVRRLGRHQDVLMQNREAISEKAQGQLSAAWAHVEKRHSLGALQDGTGVGPESELVSGESLR